MCQDNRMSRMSYQPSHLENKEWGKLPGLCIHSLVHTAESDIFLDISAFYYPERNKTRRTEYDRMIHEELQRVATCRFQSGSRVWPVGRIWYSICDILGYSDAIEIPFGK
jgi:hypothetical protein